MFGSFFTHENKMRVGATLLVLSGFPLLYTAQQHDFTQTSTKLRLLGAFAIMTIAPSAFLYLYCKCTNVFDESTPLLAAEEGRSTPKSTTPRNN